MKVNDIIKTKSGKLFTVQRAETLGRNNIEYLLLYEVYTGDLAIGYVDNDTIKFINDPEKRNKIAKLFDEKKSK